MKLNFFVPKPRRFVAVDFNQAAVRIAYLESAPHGVRLLDFEERRTAAGESPREEAVEGFIKKFMEKNVAAQKSGVAVISDAGSVFIKYLAMPVLPPEEILNAARWQLKSDAIFNLEDAVGASRIVRSYTDEQGIKQHGVLFVAVKKTAMDEALAVLGRCQITPDRVTTPALNYETILKGANIAGGSVIAVLDIDYRHAFLNIYIDRRLGFVWYLPVSSEKIALALTETLVTDKGKIQLTLAEAEEIRDSFGIPDDDGAVWKDRVQGTQVIALIRPLLELLVREIKFSIDYFIASAQSERVATLFLTGVGSNLKNLDKYLSHELGMPIAHLPLPSGADVSLCPSAQNNILASLIGGAIPDSSRIDLLPLENRTRRWESVQNLMLRMAGMTLALGFLILLYFVHFQAGDYKKRHQMAGLHLQTIENVYILKQQITSREGLIEKIQKNCVPVEEILNVVSRLIPAEIILDEMGFDQAAKQLRLTGTVFSDERSAEASLVNFMQSLEGAEYFSGATLVSLKKTAAHQQFEIRCDLDAEL